MLVEAHLATGRSEPAADAAARLSATAAEHNSLYLGALAARAEGLVQLATGSGDGCACLRAAVSGFADAEMPLELALTRLQLARALGPDRPELAVGEARAALAGFERLQAARHIDAAAACLRSLGVRPSTALRAGGLLTARESEVLQLLGCGLSNPQISDRLFISRKTVEHHVGNILAKLGLRGRAEAAAYAVRRRPSD
jgi:DNA-binding NarL/FixJ family response regulator